MRLRAIVFAEADGEDAAAVRASVATTIAEAGGELIQVMHGLVLATFASARDAIAACRRLDRRVRVGLSCGDVLCEDGLVHGLPVIEASRLRDAARPGQVLCVTRVARIAGAGDAFTPLGERTFGGLPSPLSIGEIRPEADR